MLLSVALAPGAIGPKAASAGLVQPLGAVLRSVAQNGIIVAPDRDSLRHDLVTMAAAASGRGAQIVQVVAADLAKDIKRYGAFVQPTPRLTSDRACPITATIEAARWGNVDAIIVRDDHERQQFIDEGATNELVALEEFAGSAIDVRRHEWSQTQRLDTLDEAEALRIVARIVRYSRTIAVADKMIGVAAKHGRSRIRQHLRGIEYLIDSWQRASPYAGGAKIALEIYTVAGGAGARAGFVDPAETHAALEAVANEMRLRSKISGFTIVLKEDSNVPPIFNDRILICGRRAWGIQHGIEDLGKLLTAGPRRPTMIDPASQARASVFRDIQALPNA